MGGTSCVAGARGVFFSRLRCCVALLFGGVRRSLLIRTFGSNYDRCIDLRRRIVRRAIGEPISDRRSNVRGGVRGPCSHEASRAK